MFAIATYLYARAGEVIALRWEDVDLDRGVVLIHRSFNRETGEVNSTKSDAARRIPIEPELRPLLEAMHGEAGGRGSVVAVRGTDRKLSRQLRRCLALAQVDRPELFAMRDPTRKAMTFHDLRATGDHVVRRPRRRPLEDQAARGARLVLDDGGLHPRGREPARRLRRGVPAAAVVAAVGGQAEPPPSFGFGFGFRPHADRRSSQKQATSGGGAGNRTRVRKQLARASTYVAGTLHRSRSRLPAGSPGT